MAGTKTTAESVKQDLPNLLGFLGALEAAIPGSVDADLIGLLESAIGNAHVSAMLCEKVSAATERLIAKR